MENSESLDEKQNKTRQRIVICALCLVVLVFLICFVPKPNLYNAAQSINGNVITEQAVTDYINDFRESNDLTDDAAWAEYLDNNNQTPATVRFEAIQALESTLVVELLAKDRGISVSDSDVETELDYTIVDSFGGQESFDNYLSENNLSLDDVKQNIYTNLLQQNLVDSFLSEVSDSVTDVEVLTKLNQSYKSDDMIYHYYLLTWSAESESFQTFAEKVLAGEATYEEFADKLGTGMEVADQGWVLFTDVDSSIGEKLMFTVKGEPSEIIENYKGIDGVNAMVLFDKTYVLPDEVNSVEDVDETFFNYFKTTMLEQFAQSAYQRYYQNYYDSAHIILYPMPSGLPYDVS